MYFLQLFYEIALISVQAVYFYFFPILILTRGMKGSKECSTLLPAGVKHLHQYKQSNVMLYLYLKNKQKIQTISFLFCSVSNSSL